MNRQLQAMMFEIGRYIRRDIHRTVVVSIRRSVEDQVSGDTQDRVWFISEFGIDTVAQVVSHIRNNLLEPT